MTTSSTKPPRRTPRLHCYGYRKHSRLQCYEPAAWIFRKKSGTHVYGACYFHLHQVFKTLHTPGIGYEVWRAEDYYTAADAALAIDPHDQVETWLEALRPLAYKHVHWMAGVLIERLKDEGTTPLPDLPQAADLLDRLAQEGVLEATGPTTYQSVSVLPYEERAYE